MDMFSLSSALLSPPCFLLSGFGSGNSAYTVNYKDVCAGVNHPSVIGKLFSVQILATGSPAGYVQMSKSEGQTDFGVQGMNAIAVPGCLNHLSPSISFHFAEIAELVPKRRRGISRLPATRKTRQLNKLYKLYELLPRFVIAWQSRCTVASSQHEFALTFSSGSCYAGVPVMTMAQTIRVVYENGVLKPLRKVDIPEHRTLEIIILDDDLPLPIIAQVAEQGGSYDFLRHAAEDIYTVDDGEEI